MSYSPGEVYMRLPLKQSLHTFRSIALSLLMLMLTMPLTGLALPYVYTYTGNPYTFASPPGYTLPPSNYHMTIEFTYDGNLTPGTRILRSHLLCPMEHTRWPPQTC